MDCPKCKKRMIKVNLRFVSYIGPYKYAYYCPTCDEKKEKQSEMYQTDYMEF